MQGKKRNEESSCNEVKERQKSYEGRLPKMRYENVPNRINNKAKYGIIYIENNE